MNTGGANGSSKRGKQVYCVKTRINQCTTTSLHCNFTMRTPISLLCTAISLLFISLHFFPCGRRIIAEFWMVALALCSATSLRVFHIFSAWGWMQEFTFLTCHAVSIRLFFIDMDVAIITIIIYEQCNFVININIYFLINLYH